MTKSTRKFMRAVERKLSKCIDLHLTAMGHDVPTIRAFQAEDDLIRFIVAEVERLEEELRERDKAQAEWGPG